MPPAAKALSCDVSAAEYDGRGARAAYVFALFGACSLRHQAQLLTGAKILQSVHPAFPLAAMLSPQCWHNRTLRELLQREEIEPLCVPRIVNVSCHGHKQRGGFFDEHWTKLNLLNLTGLEVAMYLDSDVVVRRNIDHVVRRLLHNDSLTQARTPQGCLEDYAGRNWFNTGVWGVKPNAANFAQLLTWLRKGRSQCYDGDQSAAMDYYRLGGPGHPSKRVDDLLLLHPGYNMKADQGPLRCLNKHKLPQSELHVVHFSGREKPFWPRMGRDPPWNAARDTFMTTWREWESRIGVSAVSFVRDS
jgi:hypothetical protein